MRQSRQGSLLGGSVPAVPDPMVELPVDKPEDPEPEGEVPVIPEEQTTLSTPSV